jgi:hypothetical protein
MWDVIRAQLDPGVALSPMQCSTVLVARLPHPDDITCTLPPPPTNQPTNHHQQQQTKKSSRFRSWFTCGTAKGAKQPTTRRRRGGGACRRPCPSPSSPGNQRQPRRQSPPLSINRSIDRSINQSINQSIHQSWTDIRNGGGLPPLMVRHPISSLCDRRYATRVEPSGPNTILPTPISADALCCRPAPGLLLLLCLQIILRETPVGIGGADEGPDGERVRAPCGCVCPRPPFDSGPAPASGTIEAFPNRELVGEPRGSAAAHVNIGEAGDSGRQRGRDRCVCAILNPHLDCASFRGGRLRRWRAGGDPV